MKVFALQKRTALNSERTWWTTWRTLQVYESYDLAMSDMYRMRYFADKQNDDSVDYCVTEFNVLTSSLWNK